ncbi:MAG: LPS export ABC transporter permease LptG [Paracoccaceae bacterium]
MTLSLYVARRFLMTFLLVAAGFFGIMLAIQVIEEIRRLGGTGGLARALELAILAVPSSVFRILPLIMILSAVALFLALARSSELVVIRAAGRSALGMLMSPLLTAVLIGGLAVAVVDPLVAATSKRYDLLSDRYRLGDRAVLSVGREGVWLRQSGGEGQIVIRAGRASPDGTELTDVTFIAFDAATRPVTRIEAASARLGDGAWELQDAKEWRLTAGGNPEAGAVSSPRLSVPSDLTRDKIRDSFGKPSAIPVWELPAFIASLERAGFSPRRHQVWLQILLALPALLAAMVLVAAGFTLRHARSGRTGMMVLLAMVTGFAVFILRNFAQVLGENAQIPVALAAWSPPIAVSLLALGLLLHLEDG